MNETHLQETAAETERARRRARIGAWVPLLSLVMMAVVVNVGAGLIDASDLEQSPDSWGYVFAAVLLTGLYAPAPMLTLLATGIGGSVTKDPTAVRIWTLVGSLVAAGCGLALIGVAALALLADSPSSEADTVFSWLLVGAGLIPLVPLAGLGVRRWLAQRPEGERSAAAPERPHLH